MKDKRPKRGHGRTSHRQRPDVFAEPRAKTSEEAFLDAFTELWQQLFSTPVHLDSALSKQTKKWKGPLASVVPAILLRPASMAEALGIGMPPGEPWNLAAADLASWRPARLIASRLDELRRSGGARPLPRVEPSEEDFPPSMRAAWRENWGEEVSRYLRATLATEAPLSLRATRKTSAQALVAALMRGSALPVRAEVSARAPLGVNLPGYAPVLGTEAYEQGLFEIQDEGSQLMSLITLWPELYAGALQEQPGMARELKLPPLPESIPPLTVVDACAGAGGKSLAIADALKGRGRVYAYDTSLPKIQALRRRATRAGLRNIQAVPLTEGKEDETVQKFAAQADIVLVDAPCTGWGVLRRNPDIKWRQPADVLQRMPQVQLRLLSLYSALVKPGGRLVYGVCTFRKEETVAIVRAFLEKHADFTLAEGGYLGPGPYDGFFLQCFTRRADGIQA